MSQTTAKTIDSVRVNGSRVIKLKSDSPRTIDGPVNYKAVKMVQTRDGFQNLVARLGLGVNNVLTAGTYGFWLVTRNRLQLEASYRGSWVCGQVVDTVAEDMTREGIEVNLGESEENALELNSAMSRLGVWDSISDIIKWSRLYGGCVGVIQVEGQDNSTPLDPETVSEGQFKGIVVYDRWQLNPDLFDIIPDGPDCGLPKYYDIVTNNNINDPADLSIDGGTRIHYSRLIRMVGIKLPFFQAITEMMWGESVLERLWDRLISFDQTTLSVSSLVNRASMRSVRIDGLRQITAAGGPAYEGLIAQMEAMREFQTNEGMTLLDKEDEFHNDTYTFGGLDMVLLQFGQQLSGACQIPLVRLFGQSPAGLNSSGESDLRTYYDAIAQKQNSMLRNPMETLLTVMYRSTFGKPRPKDMTWKFKPLWQMSATDKATNSKTTTETIIGAYESGLTTRGTAMKELRDQAEETGIFSNITDDDIKDAEEEEPPMPDQSQVDPSAEGGETEPNGAPKPELPTKSVPSLDADFKESDHPRKDDGKFGSGGGSAKGKNPQTGSSNKKSNKPNPSEAESKAIRFYTGSASSAMKEADRGNPVDAYMNEQNDKLNKYLEKAPKYGGTIHRGLVVEEKDINNVLAKYKKGETIKNESKESWTKDPESVKERLISVSKDKENPVKVFFEYPESNVGVDISEQSRFQEEQEVLVPKKTKYKVKEVKRDGDTVRVIFENAHSDKTVDSDIALIRFIKRWMNG